MKKPFLFIVGILFAQFATAQTVVVLDLPTPCSNVGVYEHQVSNPMFSFDVCPNPVGDFAVVSVEVPDGELGKISIELSDFMGRVVWEKEFYSVHNCIQTRFETQDLDVGIYIVTMRCDAGVLSKKMIKR